MPDESQPADEYEKAFCEAVERYSDEWSPVLPNHPQVAAGGKWHPIRGTCALVRENPRNLQEKTIDQLFRTMHDQHDELRLNLIKNPTYATGAKCLIELMDERETAYKGKENSAATDEYAGGNATPEAAPATPPTKKPRLR